MTEPKRTAASSLALLVLIGLVVSGCGNGVDQPDVEPVTSQAPSDEPSEGASGEARPNDDGFLIPLEELAALSPAEITELTTITVDSVTVDGQIDWDRYSERLVDVLELYVNAGSSQREVEEIYLNSRDSGDALDELRTFYEQHIEAGFAQIDKPNSLTIIKNIHLNQQSTSYIGNLRGVGVTTVTLDYVSSSVVSSDNENTLIDLSFNIKNNFFSSGALDPDSTQDVENAGTDRDRDELLSDIYRVRESGGNLYLVGIYAKQ